MRTFISLTASHSCSMCRARRPESRAAGACSIRALEPVEGVAIMRQNRGVERLRDLARGPGRLAQALRIDRSLDGLDLCRQGPLWLGRDDHEAGKIGEREIGESVRIGISREAERVLRFYLRGSPFVSGARSLNE